MGTLGGQRTATAGDHIRLGAHLDAPTDLDKLPVSRGLRPNLPEGNPGSPHLDLVNQSMNPVNRPAGEAGEDSRRPSCEQAADGMGGSQLILKILSE
ncbi:hypothetical protein CSOJ01_01643 [Colletotrichum sojae]|uniref:Uncharacterized protein n=1 Tax=Colletotrichum sojae TaxID=2175907 RepID=A0A8H6N4B5_9PEZI|nr:hypothetical protein CSOJ01_01643 [Colletotrichum sojae]